jgi:arabinose-5-phosphate isomerase
MMFLANFFKTSKNILMQSENKSLQNNIVKSAFETIKTEIEGLNALFDIFNENYIKAVEMILNCKGRIIFSGMGKSGHIASKISATFASTGTPSFFIHPAEASHGDLGMITTDDIVILLSNSGETKELKDIIYYCKRFDIPIIGFIRRKESELTKESSVALVLPAIAEANKINAPTTSTTMMLALGDAIAVSLIEAKNFNSENFSIFHPGGKLGSNFIKVRDLMRIGDQIPIVKSSQKMADILFEMTSKHLGCTAVIDEKNKLIGIITDGDLRRHIDDNFLSHNASEIMTKNPITTSADKLIAESIRIMNSKSITNLFVLDKKENIIGILHLHDCLRAKII